MIFYGEPIRIRAKSKKEFYEKVKIFKEYEKYAEEVLNEFYDNGVFK